MVPAEAGAHDSCCRDIPAQYHVQCALSPKPSQSIFLRKVSREIEKLQQKVSLFMFQESRSASRTKKAPYKTPANSWYFGWYQTLYLLSHNSSFSKGCVVRSVWFHGIPVLQATHEGSWELSHWGCSLICPVSSNTLLKIHQSFHPHVLTYS